MSAFGEQNIRTTGKFLKIESGSPHHIHILSDAPFEKVSHWIDNKSVNCAGEGCPYCKEGSQPIQRFKVNVFDFTLGKVMIFEYGASIAKQIREIDKNLVSENSDIKQVDLKVSVSGSGMQKKYSVMPWMPPKPLPSGLVQHKLDDSEIPF